MMGRRDKGKDMNIDLDVMPIIIKDMVQKYSIRRVLQELMEVCVQMEEDNHDTNVKEAVLYYKMFFKLRDATQWAKEYGV